MNEKIMNYLKLFLIDNNFKRTVSKIAQNRLITYYGTTNKVQLVKIKEKLEEIVGNNIISDIQTDGEGENKFFIEILDVETFSKEFKKFVEKRFKEGKEYWEVKILEQNKDECGNVYEVYMNTFEFEDKIDAMVFSRLYDKEQVVSIQKTIKFNLKV